MKEPLMIMGSISIAMFWELASKFMYLSWRMTDHYLLIMHFENLVFPMRTYLDIFTKGLSIIALIQH